MDARTTVQILREEGGILNWWHRQFIFDDEYDPIVEIFITATICLHIYGITERILSWI
jgi:hypothetical protein